jgi:hypothetical protein
MSTLKGGLEQKDIEVIDTFEDSIKSIGDDIILSAEDLAEIEANLKQ